MQSSLSIRPAGVSDAHPHPRPSARFERCRRLLGAAGMQALTDAHVAVFGLGGVGSYAAEGLARSGVGRLTVVDFDRVCITNVNRQIHAFDETVGAFKATLMGERIRRINPDSMVRVATEFYDHHTATDLLSPRPDVVIDCIDNVTAKIHLVATCLRENLTVVTVLGSGAKLDPTRIRVIPLSETHTDPLGRALRKYIRRRHGISDALLGKVQAVFSDEAVIPPQADDELVVCGQNCICPGGANPHHSCRERHVIYGSAVFVTAAFGMAAAGAAVRWLLKRTRDEKIPNQHIFSLT